MRFLKTTWDLFWYADTRIARVWLAMASWAWAVMLLWPGDSFNRSVYHIMDQLAPETVWGLSFLLHGIGETIRIYCNGSCLQPCPKRSAIIDMAVSVFGCSIYTISSAAMIVTWPLPSAIAPHIVLSFGAWFLTVRSGYPQFHRRVTDEGL